VIVILTVTYSVNGKPIKFEDLKNLKITRKDYIAYVENLKEHINKERRKNKKG
jgi:hypothetical protein